MQNVLFASLAWIRRTRLGLLILTLAASCAYCFGQLPTDLDLPSETLDSGYLVFQAANSITSSGSFLVQPPSSVTLTSGSYIVLAPGFDAIAEGGTGTIFHAVINPNVTQWQPIPVPPPPTPCTYCGLDHAVESSGASPQDIYLPTATYSSASGNFPYAVCWGDQTETYTVPCNIALSTGAYLNTNGHHHNSPPAPVSSITPTSGYTGNYPNYEMPVTLATTQVGQVETIFIAPTNCPEGVTCIEGNYDYAVGYSNLVYIDNSSIFTQIGGNTTGHGDNTFDHWMTVFASTGLQQATTAYLNQYNPGQKICINDMALPIGGTFDICWSSNLNCRDKNGNLIVNPWGGPHFNHDLGTAADVAATTNQCDQHYIVNIPKFQQACTKAGATLTIPEGTHAHCQWSH